MPLLDISQHNRLFQSTIEDAKARLGIIAPALGISVEEAIVEHVKAREAWMKENEEKLKRAARDAASKRYDGMPISMLSPAIVKELTGHGLTLKVEVQAMLVQDEDTGEATEQEAVVLRALVPAAQASATNTRSINASNTPGLNTRKKYKYYFNDVQVAGEGSGRLSVWLKENHPGSVAWATLQEYAAKDNKSKLGAWQAIERDPVLFPQMKQVEVA